MCTLLLCLPAPTYTCLCPNTPATDAPFPSSPPALHATLLCATFLPALPYLPCLAAMRRNKKKISIQPSSWRLQASGSGGQASSHLLSYLPPSPSMPSSRLSPHLSPNLHRTFLFLPAAFSSAPKGEERNPHLSPLSPFSLWPWPFGLGGFHALHGMGGLTLPQGARFCGRLGEHLCLCLGQAWPGSWPSAFPSPKSLYLFLCHGTHTCFSLYLHCLYHLPSVYGTMYHNLLNFISLFFAFSHSQTTQALHTHVPCTPFCLCYLSLCLSGSACHAYHYPCTMTHAFGKEEGRGWEDLSLLPAFLPPWSCCEKVLLLQQAHCLHTWAGRQAA